jgi:hypothetical protein
MKYIFTHLWVFLPVLRDGLFLGFFNLTTTLSTSAGRVRGTKVNLPLFDAFPRLYPKAGIYPHFLPVEAPRVVTAFDLHS